jgi:hypothetical protein
MERFAYFCQYSIDIVQDIAIPKSQNPKSSTFQISGPFQIIGDNWFFFMLVSVDL